MKRILLSIIIIILVILFVNLIDCKQKDNLPILHIIKKQQVDNIKIGMRIEEFTNYYRHKFEISNTYDEEGMPIKIIKVKIETPIDIGIKTDEYGTEVIDYILIKTTNKVFLTEKKVGTGSSFIDVKNAYPHAKLFTHLSKGLDKIIFNKKKNITLNIEELNATFGFDTDEIPEDWFNKKEKNFEAITNIKVEFILLY